MSNESAFDLRIASASLDELTAAHDYLLGSAWDWELTEIERLVHPRDPESGYRFRARARTEEGPSTQWISGEYGLLAELLEAFPGLRLQGRFRDAHGHGFLDGTDKEYERQFDDADDADEDDDFDDEFEDEAPLDPLAAGRLLVVASDTPLAEEGAAFTERLEAIAEVLLRTLEAVDVGCTVVGDETLEWTVSAEVERLLPEQIAEVRRELRRLRVPLDTRLEGAGPLAGEGGGVWPLSNRPWRSIF